MGDGDKWGMDYTNGRGLYYINVTVILTALLLY